MNIVYIYGSDDGITWSEDDGSTRLKSEPSKWGESVQFHQHPSSKQNVYVTSSGKDVYFSLEKSAASAPLAKGPIEMKPDVGKSVALERDIEQGERWHGGYTRS